MTRPREAQSGAIFLSEYLFELNEGAGFLQNLAPEDLARVRASGSRVTLTRGEGLFFQGDVHTGVWVVESGRIRTFYSGPSGREITLAYWTEGHFVGGPEVFGRGRHVWSADCLEDSTLLFLPGRTLRTLTQEIPAIATSVINGLIAKGKCYSALVQMLGTRSVSERLVQLLVILADTRGIREDRRVTVERSMTYEQMAAIVGATRQWVSQSLDRLKEKGLLEISRKRLVILDINEMAGRTSPCSGE